MTTPDLSHALWRKSSRSDNNGGACVEVAELGDNIAVRDSKNPDSGVLWFTRREWQAFIDAMKHGELDQS